MSYITSLLLWCSLLTMAAAKTCHSMDVRNHVNNIKQLEGCHVIEGFLQVVLIDNAKEEHFANYTFPELREVTEYVIFFRVNGLRSIRSIFPNLSVIRGEQLAMDYALIINELPQLQEINLPSLVIIRGAVSLGKNQRLCFANTIDWDQVAADSSSHLIFSNGDVNCPRCGHCPNNRCWNSTTCQVQLEWKSPEGEECDKQCLGGCKGRGPKNCTACKHVNYKGTCIKFCPPDTYVYKLRYCISAGECANPNFHPNRTRHPAGDVREWFTFNRTCIQECPYGYERVLDKGCQPCGGMCKKVCSQTVVDSLQSAQSLRDCTFINGSLAIQISSGKSSVVAKELENNLGKIEEIVGYLKIARSYPLVDLNFLKNLRIIHGKSTFDESPFHDPSRSFIVIDNQNLQDIWDWDSRPPNSTFEIRRGRPFFHHNPKLCLKHIYRLMNSTGLKNLTDIEVARNSNGDQFACHVLNLSVSVHLKYSNSVVLVINPPSQMTFIRYIAYYKKATINMTTPHGDDECGDNGWNMNDVLDSYGSSDNMNRSVYHSINRLEPDTLYAFYVATYTVDSMGAESSLQHFRTLPSMPDMPTKFMVHSNSSSEIVLRWDPPLKPNGQIKKYILTGFLTTEYSSLLENRNYCEQPVKAVVQTTPPPKIETFMKPSDDCCDLEEKRMKQSLLICEARDKSLPKIPLKIANDCDQYWYDLVANRTIPAAVSSYREKSQRIVKRSAVIAAEAHLFNARDVSSLNESEVYQDNKLVSFVRIFDENVQEVSIRDLKHYSSYGVTVTACRERVPEEPLDVKVCSQYSIEYALTLPDPSADDVVDGLSVVVYNRTARLSWKKPIANGVTVSYHVELLRTDVANAVPQVTCVPATMADGTYELHDLPLGDFRVRLKSLSLADSGKYTDPVEFSIIEYSFKSIAIVVIVILILLITIGTGVGGYYFYKTKSIPHPILITSINPEYCGVPFDDEWEIPREKIKIIKELKRGNFGIVCEGVLLPENTTVAVKKVIESASSRDVATFMNEALVMKRFTNCHHIVRLIGVVSKDYPQLVIMEMMAKGDLKSFLRESRDNTPPSPAQMCLMAAQIADGMAYLEAEKFVHRDLAARNCMVTIDNVVKIGDFGMTRDVYETDYYRKGSRGLLPVRWMAPESLNDGVFSTKSDVWSYGVVLWEMITLASQPYQGMSNEQVLQYVVSGNKLDLPPVYPKRFKAIMFWCWKWKPKFRPSFIQILMEFEDYMTLHFRHTAYYYTPEGIQAKEATLSAEQEDVEILENNTRTRFSRTNGQTAANS